MTNINIKYLINQILEEELGEQCVLAGGNIAATGGVGTNINKDLLWKEQEEPKKNNKPITVWHISTDGDLSFKGKGKYSRKYFSRGIFVTKSFDSLVRSWADYVVFKKAKGTKPGEERKECIEHCFYTKFHYQNGCLKKHQNRMMNHIIAGKKK